MEIFRLSFLFIFFFDIIKILRGIVMKRCRITVIRKTNHTDLSAIYENPIFPVCDMEEGQVFYSDGTYKPEGMCESAWNTIMPFVMILSCGGENIYGDWMKNKKSAMISCNDGFRPVSFYIEAIEEKE